jgi:hypothetical protein
MTTTYTFDQLKEDVRKEAEALRVHATKEELGRLDFEQLQPSHEDQCIFGLMTGNCYSKRAAELINICAISHFDLLPDSIDEVGEFKVDKEEDFIATRIHQRGTTFSAIEAYICLPEAHNENLIAFLKGETDNLEL